jgi:stress response protein SCP2
VVGDLLPGANVALPGAAVTVGLSGPFDLSALVVGTAGQVGGDADMVFWNAPDAPGVRLDKAGITVIPERLRRGAARVVVVASPEREGVAFGSLPAPAAVLADPAGRPFARLSPPRLRTETVLLLAEVYRRDGRWRVRAVGQGYADGLAGLARDFGVDVADDGPAEQPDGPLADVVSATNAERARHGLGLLAADPRLAAAAQGHSEDMVRRAFFAHENPDGAQVWDRAVAAGYPYRKVAENIAAGQPTAADVVRGWMDSPGHRANILDGELTQIGVGRAAGGTYGVYWTQVFGTPR